MTAPRHIGPFVARALVGAALLVAAAAPAAATKIDRVMSPAGIEIWQSPKWSEGTPKPS